MALWPTLLLSITAVALTCLAVGKMALREEARSKRAVLDWLKSNPRRSCGGALVRFDESDLSRALIRFRRTVKTGPAPEVWSAICPDCGKEVRVAERKGRVSRFEEVEEPEDWKKR